MKTKFKYFKNKNKYSFGRLKINNTNKTCIIRYLCYRQICFKVFVLCNAFLQIKSGRDLSILFTYAIYLFRFTRTTAAIISIKASKTPRIYPTNSPVEIFSGGFPISADRTETK